MMPTVLYRGLISGYTAVEAAFVGNKMLTKGGFALILRQILIFFDCGVPGYPAGRGGGSLNS